MRLLWSLPKAAPSILRHVMSYAELAGEDLHRTRIGIKSRLLASLICGVAIFFIIQTACLALLALTWDTPHRLVAIMSMGGAFLVIALFAGLYRSRIIGAQSPFLETVRKEWAEDRVILEKILSDHQD